MKSFVLLLFIGCIILCLIPKDKNKYRWFHIIQLEESLRNHNGKSTANKLRKMRKKAKTNKNLAKYLDSFESSLRSASYSNSQQREIDYLQSQIQNLQWQNQQLEWKTKY